MLLLVATALVVAVVAAPANASPTNTGYPPLPGFPIAPIFDINPNGEPLFVAPFVGEVVYSATMSKRGEVIIDGRGGAADLAPGSNR